MKGKQVNPELRIAFINECSKQAIEHHKQGVRHLNISEAIQACVAEAKRQGIDGTDLLDMAISSDEDGNVVVMLMKDGNVVAKATA